MDPALEGPWIVLDTIPEAYVRLDNDFRFTFVNRAALSLLGKMPAELLGKKLWDVYPSSAGTPLDLRCRRDGRAHSRDDRTLLHIPSMEFSSGHARFQGWRLCQVLGN